MSRLRDNQSGLTIVETLIVLATAALILLIVLLALPALQRNSRNNQRNQDAQVILQAVSSYELNHAGTVPNTFQLRSFLRNYEEGNLTLFEPSGITVQTTPASSGVITYPVITNLEQLVIFNHAKCSGGGKATNKGAGYSDVVALYAIETASSKAPHCQQL